MTPVEFRGCNVIYGANQPEYLPLPAMRMPDGEVITCFQLTDEEVEKIVATRRIYFHQLTFNQDLQPIMPMVELGDNLTIS